MFNIDNPYNALLAITLSMPRIMLVLWLLPFLGESILPGSLRNIFGFSLGLIAIPAIYAEIPPEGVAILSALGLLAKEAFIGLLLGFSVAILFWVAVSMAFLIDSQRGATMASILLPSFGGQVSLLGSLFVQYMAVLFFITGGFLIMLKVIYYSYDLWPVLSFFPQINNSMMSYVSGQFQWLAYLTVFLAAPLLILMFLIDFTLGLVNRYVPQLQVFFLSMPIKGLAAIFILSIYLMSLTEYFQDKFLNFFDVLFELDALMR